MEGTSQDLGALKEEFVHLMRLIHREQFHSAWTPKNLSKPEMHALMCIWIARTHHKEARPTALAKYSHVSPSAVSQTLKTLEEKALVKRVRSEKDSRSVVIELTEEGRALVEEAQCVRSRYFNEMFEAIGVDDIQTLMRIMRRVLDFCASHEVFEMYETTCEAKSAKRSSDQPAKEVLACE